MKTREFQTWNSDDNQQAIVWYMQLCFILVKYWYLIVQLLLCVLTDATGTWKLKMGCNVNKANPTNHATSVKTRQQVTTSSTLIGWNTAWLTSTSARRKQTLHKRRSEPYLFVSLLQSGWKDEELRLHLGEARLWLRSIAIIQRKNGYTPDKSVDHSFSLWKAEVLSGDFWLRAREIVSNST